MSGERERGAERGRAGGANVRNWRPRAGIVVTPARFERATLRFEV